MTTRICCLISNPMISIVLSVSYLTFTSPIVTIILVGDHPRTKRLYRFLCSTRPHYTVHCYQTPDLYSYLYQTGSIELTSPLHLKFLAKLKSYIFWFQYHFFPLTTEKFDLVVTDPWNSKLYFLPKLRFSSLYLIGGGQSIITFNLIRWHLRFGFFGFLLKSIYSVFHSPFYFVTQVLTSLSISKGRFSVTLLFKATLYFTL